MNGSQDENRVINETVYNMSLDFLYRPHNVHAGNQLKISLIKLAVHRNWEVSVVYFIICSLSQDIARETTIIITFLKIHVKIITLPKNHFRPQKDKVATTETFNNNIDNIKETTSAHSNRK